jgi:hypothetical protein
MGQARGEKEMLFVAVSAPLERSKGADWTGKLQPLCLIAENGTS